MHATLIIEKIRGEDVRGEKGTRFDDIKVNAAGEEIEIVFANGVGDLVRLVLPRAKLKEVVSWRSLLSL